MTRPRKRQRQRPAVVRRGRPVEPDSLRQAGSMVSFRLLEEHIAELDRRADAAGLSRSALLRAWLETPAPPAAP